MSTEPDFSAVLDDLYIGNLSSALTLHDHPELGITHVLSMCPEYPEYRSSNQAVHRPTVKQPLHRCIPIVDSEYEDILVHLPSAVAFIKNALDSPQAEQGADGGVANTKTASPTPRRNRSRTLAQNNRVLVHCVMGISRSTTVVCAYLMATRGLSPSAALMFIRKRRPEAHPNYGFRRQLAVFAECGYFANFPAPVNSHPAYTTWMRKRKREVGRFLMRVGDVVGVKVDGDENTGLSITDDFPTDITEADSLLSEIEATHFLTISPASHPPLPPSCTGPILSAFSQTYRRPPINPCPPLSMSSRSNSGTSSTPGSVFSSPPSSRASSFSSASTAATSVASLNSLFASSKTPLEAIIDSDDESVEEPGFLALSGVKHHHIEISGSSPADTLVRLNEAVEFIRDVLEDDSSSDSDVPLSSDSDDETGSPPSGLRVNKRRVRRHVLIHSSTESRACLAICAYLMSARAMSPPKAYAVLEKALPLFNPTKAFLAQLELFHACTYEPTYAHPQVRAWLENGARELPRSPFDRSDVHHAGASSGRFGAGRASTFNSPHSPSSSRTSKGAPTRWKGDSDAEGEDGGCSDKHALRRKIGTPARCGSFAHPYAPPLPATQNSSSHPARSGGGEAHAQAGAEVDVEALLARCAGAGDPAFAFDVEAFRGALRGIAKGKREG